VHWAKNVVQQQVSEYCGEELERMETILLSQQGLPAPNWPQHLPSAKQQILLKAVFASIQHPSNAPLTQEELIYSFASLPQMSNRPLLRISSVADTAHVSTPNIRVAQINALTGVIPGERYGYNVQVTLALDRNDGQVVPLSSITVTGVVPQDQLVWQPLPVSHPRNR
jgi:hypothetical protein